MNLNILVVDDDEVLRNELSEWLSEEGHNVKSAGSGEAAVDLVKREDFNLILTDMKMPGLTGLDVLNAVKEIRPHAHMVMITAYGTIDTAVEAMKIGADDYITKPFEIEQLRDVIENITREIEFEKHVEKFEDAGEPESHNPFELFRSLVHNVQGLCFTQENPGVMADKYNLGDITIYQLSEETGNINSINPQNIYDIKLLISGFYDEHPSGVVLFEGIEAVLDQHPWEVVRKFVLEILNLSLLKPSRLIISVKPQKIDRTVFEELKDIVSNPYIQLMTESLSSPIRRRTVKFLSNQASCSFSEIQRELNIRDAPKLSFHLKKLTNDKLLQKDQNKGYLLTDRGISAAQFLVNLENDALGDLHNNILLISGT